MVKAHAWSNHWVDLAAKEALKDHFAPLYMHLVKDFRQNLALAKGVYTFQARVALLFANDKDAPDVQPPVQSGPVEFVCPHSRLAFSEDIHPVVYHRGFARSLLIG